MSKGKRKTSVVAMMAVLASLLLPILATPASAAAPVRVTDKLEGCKPNPASSYQTVPNVICTVNSNYTTGNLGKSWNELDLVPYRYTAIAGNNAPATQTYTGAVALDGIDGGKPGYDVISALVKNTALSTGGAGNCAVTSGPQSNLTPGFGGTDTTIYRLVTITQAAGTTCVFDYYGRLAVGASQYPGSSLHANVANEALTQSGSDVSIPVNQISPQELDKTMVASQDSDHTWTVDKDATPAHLDFENVCDPAVPTSLNTSITITWDKLAADPSGVINIHTVVEATNPAARVIRVLVSDQLYSGANPIGAPVTNGPGGVPGVGGTLVPANAQGFDVLTYDTTVPAGTTNINDIATASYIDDLTGVPVPGQTEATASITEIQDGAVTNATATITDTEAISGAGLSFSVAAPSVGSFTNYTAGDVVSPGGTVEWDSGSQSDDGSVTFAKTVYLDASLGATSGTLDDTATLTGSDGFTVNANASVTIDSTLSGSLVINKSTSVPVDGDTVFEFEVNPGAIPVTVTILDGETTGTSDALTGLTAGDYTVTETNSNGFTPAADQNFTIGAGACDAELDFENTFGPATAQAFKVTVPAGAEAGWVFTATLDGNPFDTGTTDATGTVQWDTAASDTLTLADEGTYTFTETTQSGFDLTDISVNDNGNGSGSTDATSCSFTVDYPADADGVFSCTFTNTEQGSITIVKQTVPSPDATDTAFNFTRSFGPDVALKDGETDTVTGLVAGDYSASETVPAGWELTSFLCDNGDDASAITLGAGDNVTCTAINTLQTGNIIIEKETLPDGSTQEFEFDTNYGDNFNLVDGGSNDSGQLSVLGSPYSVEEINIPAGWTLKSFTCDNNDSPSAITVIAGDTVTCTATNEQAGKVRVVKTFNGAPPSGTQSFTFDLRIDAAVGNEGTTLETKTANAANGGIIVFDTELVPGDTYQLCELNVPAGGHSSISDLPGAFSTGVSPADNSTQCVNFTVEPGETKTFEIDNTPPPGGDQRTIGYWKNHASCKSSQGKQDPVLDNTLALFPIEAGQTTHGFFVGDLYVDTCAEAVALLNKTAVGTVGKGKKLASNALFNLASQYVAAKLNVQAGAGTCAAANTAIADAQTLLAVLDFNGVTSLTPTALQTQQALSLAATLDDYNNGGLCP